MKKTFLLLFVAVSMTSCIFYSQPSCTGRYIHYSDYSYYWHCTSCIEYQTQGIVVKIETCKDIYSNSESTIAYVHTNTTYTLIDISKDPYSLKVGDIIVFN